MNHLTGHIDRAVLYSGIEGRSLLSLEGWILHQTRALNNLTIELSGSKKIKARPMKRPDVAERLPTILHAVDSGFLGNIEINDATSEILEVTISGTLENGDEVQAAFSIKPEKASFDFETARIAQDAHASKLGSLESREALLAQSTLAFETFLSNQQTLSFQRPAFPHVSIILVLHNQAALTYSCLASLKACEEIGFEIIIVDNNSTDKTEELLKSLHGVVIIKNSENSHFVEGANKGASVATGEFLVFLNNDTVVLPGAIASALQVMKQNPTIGALGGALIRPDGRLQEAGSGMMPDGSPYGIGVGEDPFNSSFAKTFEVDYVSGAFLCTPTMLFKTLKGFDPCFAPAYYEDADYCYRARALGYKVCYEPRIRILHIQHASTEDRADVLALMNRNRPIFVSRHLSRSTAHPALLQSQSKARKSGKKERKILYIDDFLPIARRGQGLPRAEHILKFLKTSGYKIVLGPTNETNESLKDFRSHFEPQISVHCLYGKSDEDVASFSSQFDTVFVSRPHNMERLMRGLASQGLGRPTIIYDAEAIFAFRDIYKKEVLTGVKFTEEEKAIVVKKEVQLASGADLVLSVSDKESKRFKKYGVTNVHVVSHAVLTRQHIPSFENRNGFITVGPVLAEDTPNAHALLWFLGEVAPAFERRIDVSNRQVTIVGENKLASLVSAMYPVARQLGVLPSVTSEYDRHKVFFAAHRYSAGIPLKIIEAGSHGVPVICTSLLAEQLGWSDKELCIADTPEEWLEVSVKLTTDKDFWTRYSNRITERAALEYSLDEFNNALKNALSPFFE